MWYFAIRTQNRQRYRNALKTFSGELSKEYRNIPLNSNNSLFVLYITTVMILIN